jgi:SAM-dependent methyltransferase
MSMIKEYWDDVNPEARPEADLEDEAAVMLSRPALGIVLPGNMASMTILSIGCDDSGPAIESAKRGAKVIVADPSEMFLDETFKDLAREGLSAELVVASPLDLGSIPKESVDLVAAGSHITIVTDLERVFRELQRVLRPRGRLLLIVPHPLMSGGRSIAGTSGNAQWLLENYFSPGPEPVPDHMRKDASLEDQPRLRTFQGYVDPLIACGFSIERVMEPQPDPRTKGLNNTVWNLYNRIPQLLIVKAVRSD